MFAIKPSKIFISLEFYKLFLLRRIIKYLIYFQLTTNMNTRHFEEITTQIKLP